MSDLNINNADLILNSLATEILNRSNLRAVGIYAYGSVVGGDFDESLSDLDILAVIDRDIEPEILSELESTHMAFSLANPEWSDRLDIAYMSKDSAKEIKSNSYSCATKYNEASFSIEEAKAHWMIDWYKVQAQSIVLFGESPLTIFPAISPDEFREHIRQYLQGWPANMEAKSKQTDLAYVVLTMCRSLYAFTYAENISKVMGAHWMIEEYPRFTKLIQKSLVLSRSTQNVDTDDMLMKREATELVNFVCSGKTLELVQYPLS
jgi:predicted nucleotidyltransferase